MTLTEIVIDTYPALNPALVSYHKVATVFIVTYDGRDVGVYDPEKHEVNFDTLLLKPYLGG